MKTKLHSLILFAFLLLSAKGFSQAAVAYTVPNLSQCGNEVFDLTTQIAGALGNQNPATHTVSFHISLSAASTGTNPITNPQAYVAPQNGVVYYRVTNTSNNTHAVNTFFVSWSSSLQIQPHPDVTVCDGYNLPPLTVGNYRTAPGGGGSILPPGTMITTSQTIFIYAQSGSCSAEDSFTITVMPTPQANQPAPYVYCDVNDTGYGIFDLTSKIPEITGGNPLFSVTFHETQQSAATGPGPFSMEIVNPTSYINVVPGLQTIFARVQLPSANCFVVVTLQLIVQPCTDNLISGKVRFDFEANGCTDTDQSAENVGVYCIGGTTNYQTFTDANGNYTFANLPDGNHVVTVVQSNLSVTLTPSAHQVTMPGDGEGKNFCMGINNTINDISVTLIPVTQARPGFVATYSLVYQNLGTVTASGTVTFVYQGGLMTYNSSTPAMVQAGNMLTFAYTNLLPFQTKTITVNFTIMTPPTVNGGDTLTLVATITPGDDLNVTNNASVLNQEVINSYDPNDMMVREGAFITLAQAQNEYLNYTIRFQNIGNADAINVRIENTLDADLDWSTLQPVASSHAYRVSRLGNEVQFIYDNINLPGSNNEPASHGYISYRIKPKPGIQLGDVMENEAAIFFDFNQPIATNAVSTTVGTLGIKDVLATAFTMYPNPASGFVTIKMQEAAAADVTITDVLGKTVLTTHFTEAESNINISALNSGMYFMTLTANGKSSTKKLVVK